MNSCDGKLVILFVVIAAAVLFWGKGALFLLFVLLSSQRVACHSGETLQELYQPRFNREA